MERRQDRVSNSLCIISICETNASGNANSVPFMTLVIFETCFLISETLQAEMHPRGKTMLVCE